MKLFVSAVLIIFAFFIHPSFGCTLGGRTISIFDETEYVFIGEVIGYTAPVESAKLRGKAFGLIIKIKESVYLPKTPAAHFEVFPLKLLADCSFGGTQIELLKNEFPINSEVRVIAKQAEILPKDSSGGARLEIQSGEGGGIALNIDENGNRMSSADSIFDYESFKYDPNKDPGSKRQLPHFEIRKDLLRLKESGSQTERNAILDRLFYAPGFVDLGFYGVFKLYTSSESEFRRYYETHFEMTDPQIFKQYKAYHDALSELARLGYQKDVAEKALGEAVEEAAEISKRKLFERSLKILRKMKR